MRPLLACFLALSACARSSPAAESPPAQATAQPSTPAEDCTFETPLQPGVPGSPGNLIPSEINPNGASELAALMRAMQRDLGEARDAIRRGEAPPPNLFDRHRKMRCAWPTSAEDRNAEFDAMAQAYLAQVRALDARPADLRNAHDAVVSACAACHEQTCAGPLEAIAQLRLSPPNAAPDDGAASATRAR